MVDVGVRSHLVAAWHAAPLLIKRGGLAVLTGYTDPSTEVIANHVFYDLAMSSVSRLARTLAHDLQPHGSPRSRSPQASPAPRRSWRCSGDALPPSTDSVEFPGRAVRALLQDPQVARYAGRILPVAELAREYGFTDVDVR